MNLFEKVLYKMQATMDEPHAYGWFHLMWIGFLIVAILIFYLKRNKYSEKNLKLVLGIYGFTALTLEIIKQLIWSFNYDAATNIVTWDYQWYAAPFQLCTTPIFVSIICLFLKKNKLRDSLLSYVAYFTILGSISTLLLPDSCLVETIEVNIHTMFLHLGSLAVSIYLMMNKEVKPNKESLFNAFKVFIAFVIFALILDISFYKLGLVGKETFNMFYISPYFISGLPVYDKVQASVPYLVYLIFYVVSIFLGALIVCLISLGFTKISNRHKVK